MVHISANGRLEMNVEVELKRTIRQMSWRDRPGQDGIHGQGETTHGVVSGYTASN